MIKVDSRKRPRVASKGWMMQLKPILEYHMISHGCVCIVLMYFDLWVIPHQREPNGHRFWRNRYFHREMLDSCAKVDSFGWLLRLVLVRLICLQSLNSKESTWYDLLWEDVIAFGSGDSCAETSWHWDRLGSLEGTVVFSNQSYACGNK